VDIEGQCDDRFRGVADVFGRSVRDGGELGASFCATVEGETVVDLWGGFADPERATPWDKDTTTVVMSSTKGATALAAHLLVARGALDLDLPVAAYWPEFAANGKDQITVRQLLAHQAGLCAIDAPLTQVLLADLDTLAGVLARQRPAWEPGQRHGYHPLTIGLYQNELIRRVDPQHRTIGQVLQDEVARPLGADLHVGLPDTVPQDRLARLVRGAPVGETLDAVFSLLRTTLAMCLPGSLTWRTFMNPRALTLHGFQQRDWLRIELPAANGVGSARGLAAAYGGFAIADARLRLSPRTLAELSAPARSPKHGSRDAVLFVDTSYALGFWKPCAALPYGRDHSVFGAPGAGGSFAFADPTEGLGFAYVPNRMGRYLDDPRVVALRDAVYQCLDELR
jgi:CubicO group peptidase (beta-lactamase class C family)